MEGRGIGQRDGSGFAGAHAVRCLAVIGRSL
jgi:hypothetical protein